MPRILALDQIKHGVHQMGAEVSDRSDDVRLSRHRHDFSDSQYQPESDLDFPVNSTRADPRDERH